MEERNKGGKMKLNRVIKKLQRSRDAVVDIAETAKTIENRRWYLNCADELTSIIRDLKTSQSVDERKEENP